MSAHSRFLMFATLASLAGLSSGCHARRQATEDRGLRPFRSDSELARFIQDLPQPQQFSDQVVSTCAGDVAEVLSRTGSTRFGGGAVISGTVTNVSGTPVPAAQVYALDVGALTTQDGTFRLQFDSTQVAGTDSLTLSAARIGYSSVGLDVQSTAGDSVTVAFQLCEQVLALDMIAVEAPPPTPSVTNVQHAGVDEGGIVKLHGDHLVILRRGRIFTVDASAGRLSPVDEVHASGPDIDPRGTWYDELLVSGDDVVVVGYSYERGGTEIGIFRIDSAGRLTHRATYQLRSDDYYSSRNYASRLVARKLVFYAPVAIYGGDDADSVLPAFRRWRSGDDEPRFEPIATAARVYRSGEWLEPDGQVVLHTVTTCDLASEELECTATSLVGSWGRVSYVSPTAAYVWVSAGSGSDGSGSSMVYRLPLDGGPPTALQVEGTPVDQFSFLEEEDLNLNVVVRSDGYGEGMWGAEFTAGDVALLRVPLSLFSDGRVAAPSAAYRRLPRPGDRSTFKNRFVGQHLLYGTGDGWGLPESDGPSALHVVRLQDGAVATLSLPHGVDRIEPMGEDAVVVGSKLDELHFTGIDLGTLPTVVQRYVRADASQGELRSHGFFYRRDGDESGVFGLPVRSEGAPGYAHLFAGSASVLFIQNGDRSFSELGELVASETTTDSDGCIASCIDWYGNARPLFFRGRVFALLGYELVEGTVGDTAIREVRRVSFAPRVSRAGSN